MPQSGPVQPGSQVQVEERQRPFRLQWSSVRHGCERVGWVSWRIMMGRRKEDRNGSRGIFECIC